MSGRSIKSFAIVLILTEIMAFNTLVVFTADAQTSVPFFCGGSTNSICPSNSPSIYPGTQTNYGSQVSPPNTGPSPISSLQNPCPPTRSNTGQDSIDSASQFRWHHHHHHSRDENGGSDNMIQLLIQLLQQILRLLGINIDLGSSSTGTTSNPAAGLIPSVNPCPSQVPIAQASVSQTPVNQISTGTANTASTGPTGTSTSVTAPATTAGPTSQTAVPGGTGQSTAPTAQSGDNYAGYYFHTTTPQAGDSISTTWTAVAIDCSKNDGTAAPFPGMGDTADQETTLSQLGTDLKCTGGTASYQAWTEALPAAMINLQNTPISQGDTITATVTYQGGGRFTTNIRNTTKGWSVDTPMSFSSTYVPKGSEVITEEADGTTPPYFSSINYSSTLNIGGQSVQMATQPSLTRLNSTQISTGNLTGSAFSNTRNP